MSIEDILNAARRAERRRTAFLVAVAFAFGLGLGLFVINFDTLKSLAVQTGETIAMRANDLFESLAGRMDDSSEPLAARNDLVESRPAHRNDSLQPRSIRVIDGDTIRINGQRPDFGWLGSTPLRHGAHGAPRKRS